jgi:hypothetical protein
MGAVLEETGWAVVHARGVHSHNVCEAWSALLRIMRATLEQHCPPGTVPKSEHLEPTSTAEAIALVKAIDALAAN